MKAPRRPLHPRKPTLHAEDTHRGTWRGPRGKELRPSGQHWALGHCGHRPRLSAPQPGPLASTSDSKLVIKAQRASLPGQGPLTLHTEHDPW